MMANSLLRQIVVPTSVVVCVASSWALATQFAKSALNMDPQHFFAPYSLVWFSTNFMLLCCPIHLLYDVWWNGKRVGESFAESARIFSTDGSSISARYRG
jgi:hypothetical protein